MTAQLRKLSFFKETRDIPRSLINPDPYNARTIDASSAKRLRESLREFGQVETLVWNEKSKTLVGGHQRLKQMDKLANYPEAGDYSVSVTVVSLPRQKEAQLNILLNNQSAQGSYDTGKLEALFNEEGINPFAAGFDTLELEMMFGAKQAEQYSETFNGKTINADTETQGHGDEEALQKEADKIAELKAHKKKRMEKERGENDSDHVLHLVFDNAKELRDMLKNMKLNEHERYQHIDKFMECLTELEDGN